MERLKNLMDLTIYMTDIVSGVDLKEQELENTNKRESFAVAFKQKLLKEKAELESLKKKKLKKK